MATIFRDDKTKQGARLPSVCDPDSFTLSSYWYANMIRAKNNIDDRAECGMQPSTTLHWTKHSGFVEGGNRRCGEGKNSGKSRIEAVKDKSTSMESLASE